MDEIHVRARHQGSFGPSHSHPTPTQTFASPSGAPPALSFRRLTGRRPTGFPPAFHSHALGPQPSLYSSPAAPEVFDERYQNEVLYGGYQPGLQHNARDQASSHPVIAKMDPDPRLLCVPLASIQLPCLTRFLVAVGLC